MEWLATDIYISSDPTQQNINPKFDRTVAWERLSTYSVAPIFPVGSTFW